MKRIHTSFHSFRYSEISKLCSALSNPSRVELLEKLASDGTCIKGDFIELEGLSKFTVGLNLKYLKKINLVSGNLSSKKLSYCLNYQKLDELKNQLDEFFEYLNQNRKFVEPDYQNCSGITPENSKNC